LRAGEAIEVVLAEVFGDAHGSRLTFRDAVPLYLAYAETRKKASTLTGDRSRLAFMSRAPWAGEFLTSLRPESLTRWATERAAAPKPAPGVRASTDGTSPRRRARAVSGATVNRDLNLGSALFRWARSMGHVTENPFREVRRFSEKGRAREVYLTAPESRALAVSAASFLRPVVVAALSTGMRRGELLALRWRAVDLDRCELHVEPETEKAGRGRTVPLTALLHEELKALKGARNVPALDGSDPVFRCADGSPLTTKVLRVAFCSAVKACEAISHEKRGSVTFHTLRHTAASLMVAAGVPIFDVAKTLGHSTIAVTMRYSHFAPEAGRAAIERLGAALGTPGDEAVSTSRRIG
jgi:integrase